RAVSVDPSAGGRELRELPRSPRIEPRVHAEDLEAAALPAVPHRERDASDEAVRQGHELPEVRDGTLLHDLPRQHPRLEPPSRRVLHTLSRAAPAYLNV